MSKRILFYLMSEKGFAVLENHIWGFGTKNIAAVITARDENVERDFYDEIKDLCERNSIKCFDRKDGKKIPADVSFAVSWRWMIAEKNLVVFHDSLLPKYRGFSPLVNMLVNGEKKIGVTALFASGDYDNGNIIAQKAVGIRYPLTIAGAIKKITPLYCSLESSIVKKIISGKKIIAVKQDEKAATYSLWRDEEDYRIDWSWSSEKIKRFVDATGHPYKGASTSANGKLYRLLECEIEKDVRIENRSPGKIIFMRDEKPVVVCGKGLLRIESMRYDNGANALPLEKFRTRFH